MDEVIIESNIRVIAHALDNGVPELDIIDVFTAFKFSQGDIFLMLTAAKLLHQARLEEPTRESLIKRR